MITPGEYSPPVAHYRHFAVDDKYSDSVIAQAIGKAGVNFINVTKWTRCKYIWYDDELRRIEIWGPPNTLMPAEKRVRKLLDKKMPSKITRVLVRPETDEPSHPCGNE